MPAEAKALLLLLARKGESAEEFYGCLEALRRFEPPKESFPDLLDTCGTGGDSSSSINVSTIAAFVAAGAGARVAKHGNRAISSKCGSSDLMAALGVKLDAPESRMQRAIRRCGIGYFHAPYYHPVFARVQALRRQLRIRTIFNLLGPLANPCRLRYQLVGVSSPRNFKLYTAVLRRLGLRRAAVCYGRDGLDEVSTRGRTDLAVIENGRVLRTVLDPRRLGVRTGKWNYRVGGIAANRAAALRLLKGELKGPLRDLIVLNSAVALFVAGKAPSIKDGFRLSERSLDSGRAYRAYVGLKRISNE